MCLLFFKHFDVCLCKVFTFYNAEKGRGGREGEKARGAHKSQVEPAAVQCELQIVCVIQQSPARKRETS